MLLVLYSIKQLKYMKTLKSGLQDIIDRQLLNENNRHICNQLSPEVSVGFDKYFEMAKNYAPDFISTDPFECATGWWKLDDPYDEVQEFITSEKYRFIKDLIEIL